MLGSYLDKYPKDIYLQVRYYPLTNMHRHAIKSALYSECAARQGKFWALNDLMMPQQSQWAPLFSAEPIFRNMSAQVGIDMQKLNTCLDREDVRRVINDEKSFGQSMGIISTPTYFINKKMVVGPKSLTEELNKYFPPGK